MYFPINNTNDFTVKICSFRQYDLWRVLYKFIDLLLWKNRIWIWTLYY